MFAPGSADVPFTGRLISICSPLARQMSPSQDFRTPFVRPWLHRYPLHRTPDLHLLAPGSADVPFTGRPTSICTPLAPQTSPSQDARTPFVRPWPRRCPLHRTPDLHLHAPGSADVPFTGRWTSICVPLAPQTSPSQDARTPFVRPWLRRCPLHRMPDLHLFAPGSTDVPFTGRPNSICSPLAPQMSPSQDA